jgi:hypothetical protein
VFEWRRSHGGNGNVHEGMHGTHQATPKMKWALRRAWVYWPTMADDCVRYYRGCGPCQKFGAVRMAPASMMHLIVKHVSLSRVSFSMLPKRTPSFSKRLPI